MIRNLHIIYYVCMHVSSYCRVSRFEWRQEYYFRSAWAISNRSHIISTAAGVLTLRLVVVVVISRHNVGDGDSSRSNSD